MIDAFMVTVLIAFLVAMAIFMVYEFVTAPEGWEDEDGFHYGRKG